MKRRGRTLESLGLRAVAFRFRLARFGSSPDLTRSNREVGRLRAVVFFLAVIFLERFGCRPIFGSFLALPVTIFDFDGLALRAVFAMTLRACVATFFPERAARDVLISDDLVLLAD